MSDVNYFDLYNNNLQELDLINTALCVGGGTRTSLINYQAPDKFNGFTVGFLIREQNVNYSNFSFFFTIDDVDVFNTVGTAPTFIPILPDFYYIMRKFTKNSFIKLDIVNNAVGARTFLAWIKLVIKEPYSYK